jgi:acyl-coenzyme A thioesterase PaaI-like protein
MASVWQRTIRTLGFQRFIRMMRFYPPLLGAGVRVRHAAHDASRVEVEMPLTPWNRNFVGTQFGGSLYAMCDPFLMIMLIERLGPGYVVWDKAGTIEFLRPGRGRVRAIFDVPAARVEEIRAEADASGRALPRFEVDVVADDGTAVARVEKVVHVRARERPPRGRSAG